VVCWKRVHAWNYWQVSIFYSSSLSWLPLAGRYCSAQIEGAEASEYHSLEGMKLTSVSHIPTEIHVAYVS
jgi:hypothetical protein